MITKYFTKVSVKFNPFAANSKPIRLFLARIPSQQRSGCAVDFKVLTKMSDTPQVKVTFKDKHVMDVNPETMSFADLQAHFNAHSRKLALKEAISD